MRYWFLDLYEQFVQNILELILGPNSNHAFSQCNGQTNRKP
jgi:hypothetical protein